MPANCTVLYPGEGLEFKMDYYLSTHMPLVAKQWKSHGLQSWSVLEFENGLDGSPPQYKVQATLVFEHEDQVRTAAASESAKEVFGDVPNFSNKGPVFLLGNVKGTS